MQTKPTRPDGSNRRVQIMDEAQRLMGERGYNGFSLQDLADRCGLTKAGLLHHFSSKERILIDLLMDRDDQHQRDVKQWLVTNKPAATPDGPDAFIESLVKVVERDIQSIEIMRMHTMLQAESLNADHPAHDYFLKREAMRTERLAFALKAFCSTPDAAARSVLALMDGLEAQWLREGHGFDLAGEFRAGITLLLRTTGLY